MARARIAIYNFTPNYNSKWLPEPSALSIGNFECNSWIRISNQLSGEVTKSAPVSGLRGAGPALRKVDWGV